jgi:hypothetical protein
MHPFLQNVSSFKFAPVTEEVALEVFQHYGIIARKTDVVTFVCGATMVVGKKGK